MILKKVIVFALICLAGTTTCLAGDRYTTRLTESGTMVFFNPMKMQSKSKGSSLNYDMTILTQSDSVAINMTLTSADNSIEVVELVAGDIMYQSSNIQIFFSDRKGKKYNTRVHIDCPLETVKKLYTSGQPLVFRLKLKDKRTCIFTFSKGAWTKEVSAMNEILHLHHSSLYMCR